MGKSSQDVTPHTAPVTAGTCEGPQPSEGQNSKGPSWGGTREAEFVGIQEQRCGGGRGGDAGGRGGSPEVCGACQPAGCLALGKMSTLWIPATVAVPSWGN